MKNNRVLRVSALIALLIPSVVLLSRYHDRAVRTERVSRLKGFMERSWIQPLRRNQGALTMDEYDGITAISRQAGISDLVYFNKYSEVRWAEDPRQTTTELFDFSKTHPLPDAVIDAHTVKLPFIQPLPGGTSSSISIPLTERGFLQGLVYFKATDEALSALVEREAQLFPPAAPRPARVKIDDSKRQQSDQSYLNGLVYFQLGQKDQALKNWESAVELDPSNEDARKGLARLR